MKAATLFEGLQAGHCFEYSAKDEVYCDVRFIVILSAFRELVVTVLLQDSVTGSFHRYKKHSIEPGTVRKLANFMRKELAEHGHDNHVIDWDGFKQF